MPKSKVGFLGVGWIGRNRMEAMIDTDAIEVIAISDPSEEMTREAIARAPAARIVPSLEALLALRPDGVVIATPSALHAEQSIQALAAGVAVFCQKPLGRNAGEVAAVVDAARRADRLLGVDLSYRFTAGMQRIVELIRSGELGEIFAIDLTFHNAYGPGKDWFFDRAASGGGCVIDLGVHLVDLALWAMDFPALAGPVQATLLQHARPLPEGAVEDYATASFQLASGASGASVRLACSWNLHAGQEAEIGAIFYGTNGAAALRNVNGSFYDFTAERHRGTQRELLVGPPDAWGGRAAANWAVQLAAGSRFDPESARLIESARILDAIYAA
ncbi:Gfo/Idh/MocA family protein [Sphingomonas sp.]|uniref:Gfo/Idh/MocA family protein n=1 Tax=Sphingomonas sp. TaxID=28214 RepID=UPI003B3BB8C6